MQYPVIVRAGKGAARLALSLVCAVWLSGCTTPEAELFDSVAVNNTDDTALLASYRVTLQDDGIPLTDVELRALLSTGDFDSRLSEAELRQVHLYFKHYIHAQRPMMEQFLYRSQNYMEYTRGVFRDRGLPEELAFLAFLESGYNPMAVSRSKATGMWQFMAPTGRQYGLKQDWWMDERRDPYRSTHAAADYLNKLYGDFNDWHLALAAYNAGEGKIGRALAGTGSKTFFELCDKNYMLDEKASLRAETQQYIPKFLAICKIMRNAQALGLQPTPPSKGRTPAHPAVALTARPGTDLAALAKQLGMPWDEFAVYNPAFTRYITPPDRHVNVYVPVHAEAHASQLLRDDKLVPTGIAIYTIAKGDTLSKISVQTGVPVRVLRDMNPKCEPLQIGARLNIPGRAGTQVAAATLAPKPTVTASAPPKPAAASAAPKPAVAQAAPATPKPQAVASQSTVVRGKHTVRAGENLASIGRQYNVTLSEMRQANTHLSNPDALRVGQAINIPSRVATYLVQPGDTMWGIARKFNMPPQELLALNNRSESQVLKPGESINVIQN